MPVTVCTSFFSRSHSSFYCGRISCRLARKRVCVVVRGYTLRVVSEIMDICSPEETVTMIVHHDPGLSQHNVYILNSMPRQVGNIYSYYDSYLFFFFAKTNSQIQCR